MSNYIKAAVAATLALWAAAKAHAAVVEAVKVAPVAATILAWFTDYAGAVSLAAGAAYAVLLAAHKAYQFYKEVRDDRRKAKQQGK